MSAEPLPELAAVHWRPRADARRLHRTGLTWTAITVAHVVPFAGAAIVLFLVQPLALPVSLASLAHAWVIPELYAQRGANVVRPKASRAPAAAEARSVGLIGDLVGHEARALHAQTGLVLERGRLGAWLVGPAGALLVRPGGHRVLCYCVGVNDPELPSGDRIAHLLLALRADEEGFATVANLAFSGARWRVRRRLAPVTRPALEAGVAAARSLDTRAMP
ncbi:MAG TPA: hypothetical protein VFY32_06805 [Solirubrobacteraceae bacterium]|nr:hypothetical protein [Solirubrobacteraceae bacterium]